LGARYQISIVVKVGLVLGIRIGTDLKEHLGSLIRDVPALLFCRSFGAVERIDLTVVFPFVFVLAKLETPSRGGWKQLIR
jgi:hypothetical protein